MDIALIRQGEVTPADDAGQISYRDVALKLQLNWQANTDTLVFASYNRGIKVGNWAFSAGIPMDELKHKPETLHSYEVGIKSRLLQPNITASATGFYYNYQDYQAFAMLGLAPQIRNSDARVFGAEFELGWQINNALDISLGGAYLNTNVDQVNAVAQWNSPVGGTVIDFPQDNLNDVELPNAPRFAVNYQLNYQLPFWRNAITLTFDGAAYSQQYLEVTNGGGAYQPGYNVSNLKLSWTLSENVQLSLWVKNVFDKVYKQYSLDLGMLGAVAYYAQPRSSGLSLHYQF